MAVTLSYNGISGEVGTLAVRTSYGSNTAGAFLTSVFASQIYLTGGAEWQGNTSQFIARATTGGGFESYLGTNRMHTYTGATVGNAVNMQMRFYMASGGNSVFGDNISTANYRLVAAIPGSSSSTDGLSVYNDNGSGYGGSLNFEHRLTASGAMSAPASRITSEGSAGGSFMDFNTRNTAGSLGIRIRIRNDAAVSINDTGTSGRLTVAGNTNEHAIYAYTSGTGVAVLGIGASGNYAIQGNQSNIAYGAILGFDAVNSKYGILGYQGWGLYTNASISVNGTTYTSDARLKENVKSINNSISILKALNPVSFDWKINSSRGNGKVISDYGLIAQEVEQVIPEMVFEVSTAPRPSDDKTPLKLEEELGTYKGIDYSRFIPFLIASIKELAIENETMKQRLTALEG